MAKDIQNKFCYFLLPHSRHTNSGNSSKSRLKSFYFVATKSNEKGLSRHATDGRDGWPCWHCIGCIRAHTQPCKLAIYADLWPTTGKANTTLLKLNLHATFGGAREALQINFPKKRHRRCVKFEKIISIQW